MVASYFKLPAVEFRCDTVYESFAEAAAWFQDHDPEGTWTIFAAAFHHNNGGDISMLVTYDTGLSTPLDKPST